MLGRKRTIHAIFLVAVVALSGCQAIVSSISSRLSDSLSQAILNSDDIDVVSDGLPAYLILVDALLEGNEDSVDLLLAAAQLKGSYAAAFVDDPVRQQALSSRALEHAMHAACITEKTLCDITTSDFDAAEQTIDALSVKHVSLLYGLGSAWAGWIDVNTTDWTAVAQLAKVKLIMQKVLELDETYELGSTHMYMGVFESLLPQAMGGRPETGREHFEKAIEISDGKNLYAKVMFAEKYARLTFNRELHDRLIAEVLNSDPVVDGLTLQNKVAQRLAENLAKDADDYF